MIRPLSHNLHWAYALSSSLLISYGHDKPTLGPHVRSPLVWLDDDSFVPHPHSAPSVLFDVAHRGLDACDAASRLS